MSAGGLTLSLAFIKEVVPVTRVNAGFLLFAWVCWLGTVVLTLSSFYVSHLAIAQAIRQVDRDDSDGSTPGGRFTYAVHALNLAAYGSFVVGLVLMFVFVYKNI
jgi:hypothetical protein